MNSPPSSAEKSLLHQELSDQHFTTHLTRGLEEVVKERDEATPEPKFDNGEFEENHQYSCEQLHKHFRPQQLKRYRSRVNEPEYWEREARHYKDAVIEKLWNTALEQSAQGAVTPTTAEGWQEIVGFFQDILRNLGSSTQEITRLRLSIDSQDYWKTEEELLEPLSKLQEYQLMEQWKKEAERKKRRLNKRVPPPRPIGLETAQFRTNDPVSTRTRSKSGGATQAGVSKRKLRSSRRPGAKPS
jgi:hypothetical protein